MKKIILGLFAVTTMLTYAVELESGGSGLEFGTTYNKKNIKNTELSEQMMKKYNIIETNNDNLQDYIKNSSLDKENNYYIGYSGIDFEDFKSKGVDLIYATNYDDNAKIGFKYSYSDFKEDDIKGKNNQVNLFYAGYYEEGTLISTIYGGQLKEKHDKADNYYGFLNSFSKEYETYDESKYIPYVDIDIKRYEEKSKDDKKTENDSISANLGLAYEKVIYEEWKNYDKKVKAKAKIEYHKEFLDDKKYSDIQKDRFSDQISVGVEIPIKISNLDITPGYEVKKSTNNSNLIKMAKIGIKYSF